MGSKLILMSLQQGETEDEETMKMARTMRGDKHLGKNDNDDNKGEGKQRQTLREGCEDELRFQDIIVNEEGRCMDQGKYNG